MQWFKLRNSGPSIDHAEIERAAERLREAQDESLRILRRTRTAHIRSLTAQEQARYALEELARYAFEELARRMREDRT